jgi:serine O-acetyltransferase
MQEKRDIYTSLVYARQWPILGRMAYLILKLLGIEIPISVKIGHDFELTHGGFGVVIHSKSRIGDRVKIYPGVTIGRSDVHLPYQDSKFTGILIENDVLLASGSKILGKEGELKVRRGTVIGANAVLLSSTGENEIWAGIPAKCISSRDLPSE